MQRLKYIRIRYRLESASQRLRNRSETLLQDFYQGPLEVSKIPCWIPCWIPRSIHCSATVGMISPPSSFKISLTPRSISSSLIRSDPEATYVTGHSKRLLYVHSILIRFLTLFLFLNAALCSRANSEDGVEVVTRGVVVV